MKSDTNKKYSEYTKMRSDMNKIKTILTHMMIQKHNSQPENMYPPKAQDPSTVVPANKKAPLLEGGHSTKIGGMRTLKNEIRSPKFYEIIIKTELKGYTALDLNNFQNHINMYLNVVTILLKDLLLTYQSIKRHYDSE